jgi:phospholipase C
VALPDIETIVVVILENRSFDHMLGYLSTSATNAPLPVEGLQDDPVWQAQHANTYRNVQFPIHVIDPAVQAIADPPHEQSTIATQINTPSVNAMRGFVESYMKPLLSGRSMPDAR